jgi:uroporphyrinogen decarboxylase
MLPPFEVDIIEETDRYIVARKENGIVTKALKEGFLDGQRMSMDQYLDFPVKTRDDFERLRERYNADDPARYPTRLVDCKTRAVPLVCPGSVGLYMRLREWMGTENLSLAFYDQPDLIHDMLDFIVDYHLRIVDKVVDHIDADLYDFGEDIAYKNGPLVSPRMFAEFFAPRYKRITEHLRRKGITVFMYESDGNLEAILPQLIECGINANIPVEVAAGMDIVRLRKEYGSDMAWVGGIDKRAIAAGKEAIKRELDTKMPYILEAGGCIPTIDGDLAPDIPLEHFQYYLELKSRYLEGSV